MIVSTKGRSRLELFAALVHEAPACVEDDAAVGRTVKTGDIHGNAPLERLLRTHGRGQPFAGGQGCGHGVAEHPGHALAERLAPMVELGQLDFDVIAVAQEELGPVQIARNGHGPDGDAWPGDFFFAGLDHIFHGGGQHVEIGAWAAAEGTAASGEQSGQRQQGQQQGRGALFHMASFFL